MPQGFQAWPSPFFYLYSLWVILSCMPYGLMCCCWPRFLSPVLNFKFLLACMLSLLLLCTGILNLPSLKWSSWFPSPNLFLPQQFLFHKSTPLPSSSTLLEWKAGVHSYFILLPRGSPTYTNDQSLNKFCQFYLQCISWIYFVFIATTSVIPG